MDIPAMSTHIREFWSALIYVYFAAVNQNTGHKKRYIMYKYFSTLKWPESKYGKNIVNIACSLDGSWIDRMPCKNYN